MQRHHERRWLTTVALIMREAFMSGILGFVRKWYSSYRVLRYRHGFDFAQSVNYGLWLARG